MTPSDQPLMLDTRIASSRGAHGIVAGPSFAGPWREGCEIMLLGPRGGAQAQSIPRESSS